MNISEIKTLAEAAGLDAQQEFHGSLALWHPSGRHIGDAIQGEIMISTRKLSSEVVGRIFKILAEGTNGT